MDLKNLQYEYCVVCFNCTLLEYMKTCSSYSFIPSLDLNMIYQHYSVYVHLLVCFMMFKKYLYTAGSFDRLIIKIALFLI